MLSQDVMDYENKVRFGSWTKHNYSEVRAKLRRIWYSEFEETKIYPPGE